MSNESQDNYLAFYDLESYLFETVHKRFGRERSLSAFDFFCIVIWKANRAKSKIARRLLGHEGVTDLEDAVRKLTCAIAKADSPRERMRALMEDWGLLLPMASAILTVLYPEEFTIYDYRVAEEVHCPGLGNLCFESLWPKYEAFRQKVCQAVPGDLCLRDKDRCLSGKSFCEQLAGDIRRAFGVA